MATNRPPNIDIHKQGEESDRPQLQRGTNPQFSVTAGETLSPTTKPVKAVTLNVYTMKEGLCCSNLKFSSGRLTTAQQVLDKVLPSLSIPQSDWKVFTLWLKSKHLNLQLKPYHLPCKLYRRWKDLLSQYTSAVYEDVCRDEPLLCVQRSAFLSLQEEKDLLSSPSDHRATIDLLYHEAVHNVTKNPYPIGREKLHSLAGLQGAVFRAEAQTEPILELSNICQFYPTYVYAESRSHSLFSSKPSAALRHTQEEFSKRMRSEYATCGDADQLKLSYLRMCWEDSMYGSVLFKGQIEKAQKAHHKLYYKDRKVHVAINTESVHVLSASSPSEVLLHEPLDHLCWEFQPCAVEGENFFSSLWLEYESYVGERPQQKKVFKLLQVFSRQAPMMDAMLCRCVGDLDLDPRAPRPAAVDSRPKLGAQEHKLLCDEYSEDGELTLCRRIGRDKQPLRESKSPSKSIREEYLLQDLKKESSAPPVQGHVTSI